MPAEGAPPPGSRAAAARSPACSESCRRAGRAPTVRPLRVQDPAKEEEGEERTPLVGLGDRRAGVLPRNYITLRNTAAP